MSRLLSIRKVLPRNSRLLSAYQRAESVAREHIKAGMLPLIPNQPTMGRKAQTALTIRVIPCILAGLCWLLPSNRESRILPHHRTG